MTANNAIRNLLFGLFLFISFHANAEVSVSSFKTLNNNYDETIAQLRALPSETSIPLSLEALKKADDTDEAWQLFLLMFLDMQKLNDEQKEQLNETQITKQIDDYDERKELLARLAKKDKDNIQSLARAIFVLNNDPSADYYTNSDIRKIQTISLRALHEAA